RTSVTARESKRPPSLALINPMVPDSPRSARWPRACSCDETTVEENPAFADDMHVRADKLNDDRRRVLRQEMKMRSSKHLAPAAAAAATIAVAVTMWTGSQVSASGSDPVRSG